MIGDKVKKIALVYEGVKAEENLFESITQNFFADKAEMVVFSLPADGNIYMLWSRLKEDDFETDLLSILKEMSKDASEKLKSMDINDFSEIYLFFDYDGHNNNVPNEWRDKDVLKEMLETFNNETEFGKLYVSYPMVESIKEISIKIEDYVTLHRPLDECGKYKEIVGGVSDYSNFKRITKEMWYVACNASRRRAFLIVSYRNESSYNEFIKNVTQEKIYHSQKKDYIQTNKQIGILNSIPLFLIEYYDEEFWDKIKNHVA